MRHHMTIPKIGGLLTICLSFFCLTAWAVSGDPEENLRMVPDISSQPLAFTQNIGQWPDSIMFRANIGGATLWFTADGIYYQFTRKVERFAGSNKNDQPRLSDDGFGQQPDSLKTMLIKAEFVGGNSNPRVRGEDVLKYKCNYFLGSDPSRWQTDVPSFGTVIIEDIYPGIDIRYTADNRGRAAYQIIADEGADLSQVNVAYKGLNETEIGIDGTEVVRTAWGDTFSAIKPSASLAGVLSPRPPALSADASEKEASRSAQLVYSTYLGGEIVTCGIDIAVDGSGCAYVTGYTSSSDFPTQNAYDASYNNTSDAFVSKFSSEGNALLYSTYLGGSDEDIGINIAIDLSGCIYLTGFTKSTDVPTQNAYDASYNGGDDVFVTKFSSEGDALLYSTYLGGGGNDYIMTGGMAIDGSGCAYMTGPTNSSDFPMQNGYDETYNGDYDVFMTRLSSEGNTLLYSTYFGGGADDWSNSIAIDGSGCTYITGRTISTDMPVQNAYNTNNNGMYDIFLTKFSPEGNTTIYSTYLGGEHDDFGFDIAVDGSNCVYVAGVTRSSDFPTKNAYDASFNGEDDAFVIKLSSEGDTLLYSTYLGGENNDYCRSFVIDGSECVYMSVPTYSSDFPMQNAYDASLGGEADGVVAKLSAGGNILLFSTYLGGGNWDEGNGIAIDGSGCAYVTGRTFSFDFPTQNAYDASFNGNEEFYSDAFVAKLCGIGDYICGDANADGFINLIDILCLIDYKYGTPPGPEPNPMESGDVNADGNVNLLDILYVIDYKYGTPPGPEPQCPE